MDLEESFDDELFIVENELGNCKEDTRSLKRNYLMGKDEKNQDIKVEMKIKGKDKEKDYI